jgi:hypothetical protein
MIKNLVFTAALLVPGLAYAGTPSVTLSGQIVPAASPPAAPAPAQAAGFTTCVICMDFTQPSGGVWVDGQAPAGVNAAQTNTWLDCAGASNPILFQGINGGVFGPCPTITTDSDGTQVLQVDLPAGTSTSGNGAGNGLELGVLSRTNLGRLGAFLSTNLYVETLYRMPIFPAYTGTPNGVVSGTWLGGPNGAPSAQGQWNFLEFDGNEIVGDPSSGVGYASCTHGWYTNGTFWNFGTPGCTWYQAFPSGWPAGGIVSNYIATGMRTASDGSTAIGKCMWINTTFGGCTNTSVDNVNLYAWQLSDASSREALNVTLPGFNVATGGSTPAEMKGWLKHIYIWACSAWRTTACSTSSADPGGY